MIAPSAFGQPNRSRIGTTRLRAGMLSVKLRPVSGSTHCKMRAKMMAHCIGEPMPTVVGISSTGVAVASNRPSARRARACNTHASGETPVALPNCCDRRKQGRGLLPTSRTPLSGTMVNEGWFGDRGSPIGRSSPVPHAASATNRLDGGVPRITSQFRTAAGSALLVPSASPTERPGIRPCSRSRARLRRRRRSPGRMATAYYRSC